MPKIGVFVSWSGNSRGIAGALYDWLPSALHSASPWMSQHDIHKGRRFLEEIDNALTNCSAGLICITPENCESVWVAFEAGALANRVALSKLVIPVVSRMRPSDVPGPLGMFQAAELSNPEDMLRLVKSLHSLNSEDDRIPDGRLEATFSGVWPNLESRIPRLESEQLGSASIQVPASKSDSQLLEEILDVSKSVRILIEDRVRTTALADSSAPSADTMMLEAGRYEPPLASGASLQSRAMYESFAEQMISASEVWLSGVSLQTVVARYFESFLGSIKRDAVKLRFLLLDPEDPLLTATATRSLYGLSGVSDLLSDISGVVKQVTRLQSAARDRSGVQLKYLSNLPSASIIMTNPTGGNGTAIAEYYPYRASSSDRPHVLLSQSDAIERKWFTFYREQYLAMWRDGRNDTDENTASDAR
ncbi:toll/interleukin-1 receptor domain-containing protein [Kribbella sp. NPDC020789]